MTSSGIYSAEFSQQVKFHCLWGLSISSANTCEAVRCELSFALDVEICYSRVWALGMLVYVIRAVIHFRPGIVPCRKAFKHGLKSQIARMVLQARMSEFQGCVRLGLNGLPDSVSVEHQYGQVYQVVSQACSTMYVSCWPSMEHWAV